MRKLEPVLKAAVLAGLALMFYAKISDGTLTFYINTRFAWLTFVAVLLLAALAMTLVYRMQGSRGDGVKGSKGEGESGSGEEHEHEHDHNHSQSEHSHREHSHEHRHGLSWGGVAIMAIPMVLGLVVPARPLGASAVSSRGIGLTAPDRPSTEGASQGAASGPKNILDWLRAFGANADPATFKGQAVDVVGFVYRDPRNGADTFWVSRFAISCCVADATAIGMLVQTAQAATLKDDGWVRVTGKLDTGEFAGEKVPVILPDKVTPTEQPQNPYLYP